jgi:spore coat polysaccharide biosynthesis protein SpsF
MSVLAVVQARVGSSRLPGKTLMGIAGRPMLAHVIERITAVPGVGQVVLATTESSEDDPLAGLAASLGIPCVRGSTEDVLDRFWLAFRTYPADAIVRVTADCPLLDPEVSGRVIAAYQAAAGTLDYVSNVHPPTYPDGLDTEVFSATGLEAAQREATRPSDREHVTSYLWRHPERFRLGNVEHVEDLSALRWTVDTAADLAFVRSVYRLASGGAARPFGLKAVLAVLRRHPELAGVNAGLRRNEGFERSVARDRDRAEPARGRTLDERLRDG